VTSEGLSGKKFFFIGNSLCLDFINTRVVLDGQSVDLFGGFDDLVSWLIEAHILDPLKAKQMLEKWGGSPEAAKTFSLAVDFRATLRRVMQRIVETRPVPRAAIAAINDLLRHQAGHAELRPVRGGFEKHFRADFQKPSHLLVPVAESACDLLSGADLSLIKKCENEACVLFFYDTTKNHSRRWCSMDACGNRMKVAAYYRRQRGAAGP
jgi:predicted RNA-binding Zn ribbon-like protein